MRKILMIARDDIRLLCSNAISLLVVIGLICMPSIYGWFNIAGSWDPYNNTGELKIAFVNDDAGYSTNYLPVEVNIGNETTAMLTKNDSFSWVFTDKDQAMAGVESGEYYAAIVIPEDFTQKVLEFLPGNQVNASIEYYSNEKLNAIAPKMTSKGASVIQQTVNTEFNKSLLNAVFKVFNTVANGLNSESFRDLLKKSADSFGEASNSLSVVRSQLIATQDLISSAKTVMNSFGNVFPDTGDGGIDELHAVVAKTKTTVQDSIDLLNEMIGAYEEVAEKSAQGLRELKAAAEELLTVCDSADRVVSHTGDVSDSFKKSINDFHNLIDDANNKVTQIISDLAVLSGDMTTAQKFVQSVLDNKTIGELQQMIGSDTNQFAQLLSAPVSLEKIRVWPIANNGSSMAAFYTSLAIWVGCTILCAMTETSIEKKRLKRYREKYNIKDRHLYFGRYCVFALLSLLQTTLLCCGNLFFLQMQAVHPVLYFVVAYLCSLLFSLLIYTLAISFGNIGKAIAVILLVLQVAASGGVFPYEMLTPIYQMIYPFLPFSYTIDAFHCAIAGYVDGQIFANMGFLIATLLPFILLLGLILRKPLKKGNAWINKQTSKTHMM